ncbi:aminoacyl-histidine dipeptidase [Fusobacterium necrophorum subsp. funduliforme]|uniref:aminoacyl-histidine dipeptidase n=1 Tax=Fusobacterium necrophorum TaxID=859 RepID=UPI000787E047|nr:aminoacyl-histidine dipeptidase [Fusobacterium necrophorum]KYL01623.1 aminoacyl-histidine dipeptidase [Fusobacterium necrophorum subsp. funduliforme]KYM38932.1 aminoacyl-histidine dipeptidase [Fusobacterium necrophorum subsp. funduliforme]KYM46704.1 aminoacyl-histidine dipeptidase [Fusobacterium necrophorum subsp. funduliforme]KYM61015.1 aminoacyl-histidine dipeptidase [Fusobacterium necrophorum subsp. funduliforme]MDK4476597.1 aminoacyl-histidine dipeptidase [Fusobacterium necrophorum]
MRKLEGLKPERVFYYFEEISKIPRESYHEREISNFLMQFGKEHQLESYQDESFNVILRKKASPGYEDAPGVILQGHMDMVCEKEEDSEHDFSKDPIDLIIDGKYVTANRTTLGADNGIAVAMGLAILEDDSLRHGPLELLLTTSEEIDLGGALALQPGLLQGKMLINIDSEEEGILTVGSAGGEGIDITLPIEKINIRHPFAYRIKIQNFLGGHSGAEIHKQRGNANKAMIEILDLLKEKSDFLLVSVKGGSKDNAIPRTAEVVIASEEKLDMLLREVLKEVKELYASFEPQVEMFFEEIVNVYEAMDENSFYRYINLMEEIPTGVYTWMKDYPDIVEASDNLAIVETEEDVIQITVSLRSSEPEVLARLKKYISSIAKKYKANYAFSGAYPEWRYRSVSPLREKAIQVWKELTGEDMEVSIIHAGLECGALSQNYPDIDFISIGPNMQDVHTPEEKLEIASTEKAYQYLVKLLEELK